MHRFRFLLSRRWLTYLLLACIFAAGCVLLSRWQMARLDEARANVERVESNYDATPIPFSEARSEFEQPSLDAEWTQVALRGTYDTAETRIVRNRPLNGQPGYEVVVPFRVSTGETVIVDRGWLPIGNAEAGRPDAVPAPPAGVVDVVVRLRPSEPQLDRDAPAGQIASINLPALGQQLGYPILDGAYGRLASESPSPAASPAPLPRPEVNEGTHLSYALQWAAFAVLMFIGFGYAARQQARNDAIDAEAEAAQDPAADAAAGADDGGSGPAAVGSPARRPATRSPLAKRQRKRPTAEEEEDAILDAQGYR